MHEIAFNVRYTGNLCALDAVMGNLKNETINACVLLGDLIDYGMHSNEVIEKIKKMPYPIICNVYGNHEASIMHNEYERFSSDRNIYRAVFVLKDLRSCGYFMTEM